MWNSEIVPQANLRALLSSYAGFSADLKTKSQLNDGRIHSQRQWSQILESVLRNKPQMKLSASVFALLSSAQTEWYSL